MTKFGPPRFHCYVKVDKHVVKKNRRTIELNRRTLTPFIGKSRELKVAEVVLANKIEDAAKKFNIELITGPVWCVFWFHFPHDRYYTRTGPRKGLIHGNLPDLSNLLELPQDALQKAGVIEDDQQICSLDLSRRVPGKEMALEVFVFDYFENTMGAPSFAVI